MMVRREWQTGGRVDRMKQPPISNWVRKWIGTRGVTTLVVLALLTVGFAAAAGYGAGGLPWLLKLRGKMFAAAGYHESAIRDLQFFLRRAPGDVDAQFEVARSQAALAKFERAVAGFGRVLRADNLHQEAYTERGHAYLAMNRPGQAIKGIPREWQDSTTESNTSGMELLPPSNRSTTTPASSTARSNSALAGSPSSATGL